MYDQNYSQAELDQALADLKKAQAELKAAKGNRRTKLRYRIKADPIKYFGFAALAVFGGFGAGTARSRGLQLQEEKANHALTAEELEKTQGAYGELKRRADEAGVDTDTVSLHVVRDNSESTGDAEKKSA